MGYAKKGAGGNRRGYCGPRGTVASLASQPLRAFLIDSGANLVPDVFGANERIDTST